MNRQQLQNNFKAYFLEQGFDINWQGFSLSLDIHPLRKHEYLFQQGELANRLYFLHSGSVRYVSVSDEGKEFTHTFIQGASVIGSTYAMVTQSTARFGIQALGDCMVSSYPWPEFYEQLRHDHAFLEYYIKFLENIFIQKDERVTALARYSAERRYLNFCAQYPELKDDIPQQYIATYIGITPIALSRIRKKLKVSSIRPTDS